ncbi:MAG TPA: sulfite exporter TauE/SafE family protein [Acidimicrobiales bacterium]|nr:sulfite exporter TauE/SafE family protein [Acidimicrobiales bacterium]
MTGGVLSLTPLHLGGLLALGFVAAGIGAVTGLGGGTVLVPVLVVGFGVDFRVAVAVSLTAVVANSAIATGHFLRDGLTNKRLALTLEVGTTLGGLTGGLVTSLLPRPLLEGVFAAAMLVSAELVRHRRPAGGGGTRRVARREALAVAARPDVVPSGVESQGALAGVVVEEDEGPVRYEGRRLWLGGSVSYVAGLLAGLLGVGGGFLKVPAMSRGMGIPVRVASATSEFMVGVTAVASLLVYFARGQVYPLLSAPVVLGVVAGSLTGTRLATRLRPRRIEVVYIALVLSVAVVFALVALGVLRGG